MLGWQNSLSELFVSCRSQVFVMFSIVSLQRASVSTVKVGGEVETIFAVPQSCRLDDVGSFCPCFRPQMAARQLELHRDTHLQHPAGPIRGEAGHHVTTMGQSEAGAGSRDTCAGYK